MTDEQVERVVADWLTAPIGPEGHLTRMLALSILSRETVARGQRPALFVLSNPVAQEARHGTDGTAAAGETGD